MARPPRPARGPARFATAVLSALVLVLAGCTHGHRSLPAMPSPLTGAAAGPGHPNIVFVLTDDLTTSLIQYMPHVRALAAAGMTFSNYTVTDSLCCPSRASIFTGKFPHDTQVLTNTLPSGGFLKFRDVGDAASTFATSLYRVGYRTAFFGKYLNGYQPQSSQPTADLQQRDGAWVPPGWTTWGAVGAGGYAGFDYTMADGRQPQHYGTSRDDYMNAVLDRKATAFVRSAVTKPNPFLLEVATFSPHKPYVPAPADAGTFAGIPAPHDPSYDRVPSPAPRWMAGRPLLTPAEQRNIRRWWQLRVEDVQSVDRMIGNLQRTVAAAHQQNNTMFVFSSDNGYHLGEHSLEYGKQTAFETDIHVPLIVAGPGIAAGSVNGEPVENIDLRPTFEQLAGARTPPDVEGHSLVPLLHGEHPAWRTLAVVEHHHPTRTPTDPDEQNNYAGNPPSYVALRNPGWIYVRYRHGDREYYDLRTDPYELHNLGPRLPAALVARLDRAMAALEACHTGASCWSAAHLGPA